MNKNTVFMTAFLLGMIVMLILCLGYIYIIDNNKLNYTTISASEINKNLDGKGPLTVGLDLDGTTFFTESIYYYARSNIDGPDGTNIFMNFALSPEWNYSSDPEIISWINNDAVGYYIPKNAAKNIIAMHKKRGDKVIFITKKHSSPDERISEYINETFGIINPEVVFTNDNSKTDYISDMNVSVYYGDSDTDITECNSADKCTPYRFLRNEITQLYTNTSYSPGKYNENVVENSNY